MIPEQGLYEVLQLCPPVRVHFRWSTSMWLLHHSNAGIDLTLHKHPAVSSLWSEILRLHRKALDGDLQRLLIPPCNAAWDVLASSRFLSEQDIFRLVINLLRCCRAIITSCLRLLPFGMLPKWLHKMVFSEGCIRFYRHSAIFKESVHII